MISIVAVGDIMPGGLLTDNLNSCANKDILNLLLQGDIRCGTLECALGNEPTYDKEKMIDRGDGVYSNVIYAKDADVRRLKELHVDVVSLANNHFFDLGVEGAVHTIELLNSEGIRHCGAGRNLEEAGEPVVADIHGKKVAFLGFCDTEYKHVYMCTYATKDTPGVNPMGEDYVISEIKKNATLYDYVVVLAHWGTEHTFYPNVSTDRMAKMMLKAGACLVLGSHPHRVQPVVTTSRGSIAYSMGNFLFPERLIAPPKVTYYPNEPIDYSTLPVTNDYPVVNCVTLKSLPFLARVGMIVTSKIENNSVSSSYMFSYLNDNNCIEVLDKNRSREMEASIHVVGKYLSGSFYAAYLFFHKYSQAALSKARKMLSKLQR